MIMVLIYHMYSILIIISSLPLFSCFIVIIGRITEYLITRFKGLGEMPADQLRLTTMDFKRRKLIKIDLLKSSKEVKKTEKLFETLMGKKAEYRYKFIQTNANFTSNLDV